MERVGWRRWTGGIIDEWIDGGTGARWGVG